MIKYILVISLIIIILTFTMGPLLAERSLVLININYFKLTEYTKKNITVAYFYFEKNHQLTKSEIKARFSLCDSIEILEKNAYQNRMYELAGHKSPLFSSRFIKYLFYVKVINESLAGEESVISEAHYIWFPWGWHLIKNELTAVA